MADTLLFDEATHTYRLNGVELPPVSRVLRATGCAPDLSQIPAPVLERARRRGISVHRICEQMDRDEEPDIEPGLEPYAEAYSRFLRETGYRPQDTEQMVYHPDLLYAGRLDSRGWLRDHRTILDRKATAAIDSVATPPQLGGYTGAYLALNPSEHIETVYALHLKNNGMYELHAYDYETCWRIWTYAWGLFQWQRKQRRKDGRS